jgi:hypothetical protein
MFISVHQCPSALWVEGQAFNSAVSVIHLYFYGWIYPDKTRRAGGFAASRPFG